MMCPVCKGSGEVDQASIPVGWNIMRMRRARGLTQKDLGDKIGRSRTQVFNIEQGNSDISVTLLRKFAEVLNCKISELVP